MPRKTFPYLAARFGLQAFVFAVGLWFFYTPSILPALFRDARAGGANDFAIWNEWASGSVTMLLALIALATSARLASWSGIVIGGWLVAAPSLLGFPAGVHIASSVAAGISLLVAGIFFLAMHRKGRSLRPSAATIARQIESWLALAPARKAEMSGMSDSVEHLPPPA